jgi:hypothetical protein
MSNPKAQKIIFAFIVLEVLTQTVPAGNPENRGGGESKAKIGRQDPESRIQESGDRRPGKFQRKGQSWKNDIPSLKLWHDVFPAGIGFR